MRAWHAKVVVMGAVVGALALGAAGCRSSSNIVIKDDSAIRQDEARRIALQAERAQVAGKKDEAIALYRKSLEQSQDLYSVWNNLGLLLMERKDYMEAAEMFKSAADLAPTDPKPYYNAALVYDTVGHSEPAMQFYVKSLERDPRHLNSLRGATRSARLLQIADGPALERVRTALLLEKDAKWREFFEREQLRIEGQIAQEKLLKSEIPGGSRPRMGEMPRGTQDVPAGGAQP